MDEKVKEATIIIIIICIIYSIWISYKINNKYIKEIPQQVEKINNIKEESVSVKNELTKYISDNKKIEKKIEELPKESEYNSYSSEKQYFNENGKSYIIENYQKIEIISENKVIQILKNQIKKNNYQFKEKIRGITHTLKASKNIKNSDVYCFLMEEYDNTSENEKNDKKQYVLKWTADIELEGDEKIGNAIFLRYYIDAKSGKILEHSNIYEMGC